MLCYHKLGQLSVSNIWVCTKDYQQRITKAIFYPSLSTAYESNNLPCLPVTFDNFSRGISQGINISLSLFGFILGRGLETCMFCPVFCCSTCNVLSLCMIVQDQDVLLQGRRRQLIKAEYHWMVHSSHAVEVSWQTRVSNNNWYLELRVENLISCLLSPRETVPKKFVGQTSLEKLDNFYALQWISVGSVVHLSLSFFTETAVLGSKQ